jgi:hypothetical protein
MKRLEVIHELIDEFSNRYFRQVPMRFVPNEPHCENIAQRGCDEVRVLADQQFQPSCKILISTHASMKREIDLNVTPGVYLTVCAAAHCRQSHGGSLGGTVATVGFSTSVCRGSRPSWPHEIGFLRLLQTRHWIISRGWPRGKSRRCPARGMTRGIFKSAWSLQTATMQPGKWQDEHRPLVDERGNVIGIVSAKLDASAALAASGALPENVNYAVKSSLLLSFLESVPDVAAKLKEPVTVDRKFEDVVKSAQDAAVLVLVY